MSEFEIIDAHVHLYRDLDLERKNVRIAGRRDRDRWGNPDSVVRFMDAQGISRIVFLPNFPTRQMRAKLERELPAASSPEERDAALERIRADLADRVRRQNEWACQTAREIPRLVPAISMQGVFTPEEMVAEVRLRAAQGARIVKMLPGMYFEYPQDERFWPMYEVCQELDIAIVSDTGTLGQAESGIAYGEPVNFTAVLRGFPRLRLVMAHFPSAFWDQRVALAKQFDNVFFDTSGSFHDHGMEVRDGRRATAIEDAVRVLRDVGIDRFIFGSDGPRFLFQPELEQILALDLDDDEKQAILAGNAKRVYRIED